MLPLLFSQTFYTPPGLLKFNENLCRHRPRGEFSLVF